MTDQRIILFRGMNTGGVRAPVGEQRAMAEAMGLKNPRTLAASGNLVVETGMATAALEAAIEREMEARFGVTIAAMARTPTDWSNLITANPFPEQAAAHPAKVVAMVMKDGVKAGALDACRALCAAGEAVEAINDVLYFWFPNGQGESGIFKKATPKMLGMGTGRNWNTVLKLAEMVGSDPPPSREGNRILAVEGADTEAARRRDRSPPFSHSSEDQPDVSPATDD